MKRHQMSDIVSDEEDHEEGSSTSDEDEDACELTEDLEKKFFKALSSIKKKDPQIYNKETRFFEKDPEIDESVLKEKLKKKSRKEEKTFTVNNNDYAQEESDDDNEEEDLESKWKATNSKSYVQQQEELKRSFANVVNNDSDCEDDDRELGVGGLLHVRTKSATDLEKEEAEYRKWLKGRSQVVEDTNVKKDMGFLHDYWNDPQLDDNEKFLKDYILNKRYLNEDTTDFDCDKFTTLEEDDEILNKQITFEHKYNFRFEEPDNEFIKSYPRIMESSLRKKEKRRKLQREAAKKRKLEKVSRKEKEIKRLQTLKYKEIQEKLNHLKKLTGNDQLAFKDEDIEKEFDPNEHDTRMEKLFNDDFYGQSEDGKPHFDDDWQFDQYKDIESGGYDGTVDSETNGVGCSSQDVYEDDFIMDCDYCPEKAALEKKRKLEARQKRKSKKKLTSALEVLSNESGVDKPVPVFDKELHKTYENYLDEYYKIDCEDLIEDMPCRFKYRQVVANSYGLTVEEILAADENELNKWNSINKLTQIRSEQEENYDVKCFSRRGENEDLKRKVLPSLYKSEIGNTEDDDQVDVDIEERKRKLKEQKKMERWSIGIGKEAAASASTVRNQNQKRKQKKRGKLNGDSEGKMSNSNANKTETTDLETICNSISDGRLKAYGYNPKKFKNFVKWKKD